MSWQNWAGTVTAEPARWYRPRTAEAIADAIKEAASAGLTVRALGSGHSFTAAAATTGAALDLSGWTDVISADVRTGLVTVRSGTTIRALNAALDALGLAMPNLGDINAQTISGAISTGTHGTGARLGGIATQVAALDLVLADGSVVSCSERDRPDLFAAARVGLGALGVISTVTLRCVPAFTLAADERPMPLAEVTGRFAEFAADNDHFEFYWFPYGRNALVKRNNRITDESSPPMPAWRRYWEYEVMENAAFGTLCRAGRSMPRLIKPLNRLAAATLSKRSYSDTSHRVFVTARRVRFVESEYAVPREAVLDVLAELRGGVRRLAHPVMFPVEIRVAAADDIWLSTAYERDSAYIAIHQYAGLPYLDYFRFFESIAAAVGGRPHWGKMHTLDAERLAALYPRFTDFLRVRDETDPERRFANPYLEQVFGGLPPIFEDHPGEAPGAEGQPRRPQRARAWDVRQGSRRVRVDVRRRVLGPVSASQVVEVPEATGVDVDAVRPQPAVPVWRHRANDVRGPGRREPRPAVPVHHRGVGQPGGQRDGPDQPGVRGPGRRQAGVGDLGPGRERQEGKADRRPLLPVPVHDGADA